MRYTFGFSGDRGASRRYTHFNLGIGKETHTKRNPRTMQWGTGETLYYMEDKPEIYPNIGCLYEAYMERYFRDQNSTD